jgi:CRP-like cAMP-binding protein
MEDKVGHLSGVDLFRDLSERDMAELDRLTTITAVPRGRVFYEPEDVGQVLFLIRKGRVQIYRISPEGKKLVIATLEPGTAFGEMAFIGQGMHSSFAEALEDCVLCIMSRADVEHMLLTRPKVALRIFEVLGRRLREAESRLQEIAFKGIPARLASLLLQLADEQGSDAITGLTHQNLGEQIGTYRETTTQTLNLFKNAGLIDISRKRILILDREGLAQIANET